ncbi:M48 family metallopeptidase [Anaerophaga thermohalophila]|uniref:M48 family metallopeptidase n=1 Tax=Anaerophaga thermohalophila TaxID=177400 RepID=UPI0002EF0BB4|nr:M48 family metallopeptidase [Anaerophaga thermohalophila]
MKKMNKLFLWSLLVFSAFLMSCSTVPITGRKQMNLLPESEIMAMSLSQYSDFLSQNKLSEDKENVEMVHRVGNRIAQAVEKYFTEHGMSDRLNNFEWEFNLVEEDTPNAWCMPGGKVVVYTGILPITENETGLAVVMGHEIAHAVARHGNERMSQQLTVQGLGTALAIAIDEKPEQTKNLFMAAYGLGSQLAYVLPYSRTHETEADQMGLIFMAMAGYNPQEAVDFWQRMSELGGEKPPEFLSTHPTDETRINNLKKFMPEAMTYYNPNGD